MATLTVKYGEGQCQEGCGGEVSKGRRFLQGHDARLKSKLYAASREGTKVTINGKDKTADAVIKSYGWPLPAEKPVRKPAAKKSTARKQPEAATA